jgi:hypothetical protein
MAKTELCSSGFRCERCGHAWISRGARKEPLVCAKCRSPYWNKPRVRKNNIKGTSGSGGSTIKAPVRQSIRPTSGRGSRFSTAVRRNVSKARAPVKRYTPSKREIDNAGIGGAT